LGAKKMEPFARHAYMAYLPTVEFGPGMTSATEIRTAWPTLNEKRKTALVMSLYPATQTNPKLAANVVKMLDTAMGVVDESVLSNLPRPNKRNQFKSLHKQRKQRGLDEQGVAEVSLKEFAPVGSNDGNDGFSEETLKKLAAQWYNGDEDPRVERTLMAAGWEIGQDEGYDNGGVFVVQSGDEHGDSYLSWPAEELEQGVAEGFFDRFKKQLTAHRGGIDLTASKENDRIIIVATSQGKELGNVIFDANGKILVAAGLGVLPEYQGQGIAEIMYDWAKELGYTVQRSPDQTDAGKGFWDKHKGEEANVWEQGIVEAAKKCPPATQDITLNLNNRQKAIDEYGYGPLNPDLPNTKFWMKKVDEWNLDSMEEAQQSLCGNCAAFDIRQETLDCIAQGIDADSPADAEGVIAAGDLGYCKFLKFKCASRRTCDAWVTGGPLQDKPVDENQGWAATYETNAQNFVGGMKASYQARENQPVAEQDLDYIEEKWSQKYKSSINCANPKGFSQKAHCAGRRK
jgi:GNAT superfamily N-acetyltransferase